MRWRVLALLLTVGLGSPVEGQSDPNAIPRRPKLVATADTNSATDYYWHGVAQLKDWPEEAAAAFYWASRIDPAWADPAFGRFVALLMAQSDNLINAYMIGRREGRRYTRLVTIDSLADVALTRNPWVSLRLFAVAVDSWLGEDGTNMGVPRYYREEHPEVGAWVYYMEGKFQQSIDHYADAIKKQPDDHLIRYFRAQPFLALDQPDSAIAAVRDAMATFRRSTVDSLNFGYVSYPFLEYSLGHLLALQHQPDSAQAAYERALLDDLTFAAAHHALARVRLSMADTTGAMKEYDEALELTPDDPVLLFELAILSVAAGQPAIVLSLLQRATGAEPLYLPPHLILARLYDVSGFKEEAVAEYQVFLQLAPRTMTAEANAVRGRLTALGVSP